MKAIVSLDKPEEIAKRSELLNKKSHPEETITAEALTKNVNTKQINDCCPKCNKHFKDIGNLAMHMERYHYKTKSNQMKHKQPKTPK